jgi:outer membrane protein
MKRLICISISLVFIIAAGYQAKAQSFKFGHINSNEFIQLMPEFDSAKVKLENLRKELTNYLETMSVDLNNKYNSYMQDNKNLSGIVRQTREQELNDMNRRIQEFQSSAETQLQEKQNELFDPVYVKFDNAIKATGKENDFLYIFDSSQDNLRYFDKTKSTDITALVKIKLGLK